MKCRCIIGKRDYPNIPKTPGLTESGIILSLADLKALLKTSRGQQFLQDWLESGKEIRVLKRILKRCDMVVPLSEDTCLSEKKFEYLCPEILVFRKPYHNVKFLINWVGEEAIRRGKKDPDRVLEEVEKVIKEGKIIF